MDFKTTLFDILSLQSSGSIIEILDRRLNDKKWCFVFITIAENIDSVFRTSGQPMARLTSVCLYIY